MAYTDFFNDLKKGITGNVLFLYGAEDYLMDWAINQIIDVYVDESARNLDVQYLDGDTCTEADIIGVSRTFSMFSEKRVVIIRNYLQFRGKTAEHFNEALLDLCRDKSGQTVLVFVMESRYEESLNAYAKKIMKVASSYEFARLDKAAFQGFVNKRVRAAGKIIGHREMDYLIGVSGYFNHNSEYDLSQLDNDLNKIINACEGDTVEISVIEELLVGKEDKYTFNLVDALMDGNKGRAMQIAETLIAEDDAAIPVLGLLIKQFEIMYDALELSKEGMSISQMAKATGVHEFRFKKAYQAARRFNTDSLREILIKAYNIERDFKAGYIDVNMAFELFIISVQTS